ncbi:glycosyltransferase family 39 protein [Paenibacillus sp. F411]|uniref:glycosyltransferase family 39 protein n=1 Tax=Paenibacillus sp. F411 TaxID=2820239 RepID=UPI001AAF3C90|nr:glycosyltransferase family 39 protein [Paenibacillus sp. F411]MBO2944774.1 glycosyltransferase family 39 protein [Paenibacillus sp. F411]
MNNRKLLYIVCILLTFAIGIILRVVIPDTTRAIIVGDETTYNHAAENLVKHGTVTFDMNGDMFKGIREVVPTSALQPGYPIYISIIYVLFGHSTQAVLTSQIFLSILSLWLIFKMLELINVRKPYIVISLALAAVYPGFLYNIDRMLTETLFTTLLLLFSYFFLRSLQSNNIILLGVSGMFLACATHVRALAFPFIIVAIFVLVIYEKRNKINTIKNLSAFIGITILFMLPWWIRNVLTFDRFMLFTEAGEGPKVWGAVPYFIDMASTSNLSLSEIINNNAAPSPSTYYKWRLFGFFQYMWGDLWDEHLVHPFKYLRPLLIIQQLIVVPCIIVTPFLLRKCRKEVLFISCFPIAFTLMNMPFHGLPRYVYPSMPFVLILSGVALERLVNFIRKQKVHKEENFLFGWQRLTDKWTRILYTVFASFFSIILFYSVYFFAYNINSEMSEYRLSKYESTSIESIKSSEPIASKIYDVDKMIIENSIQLKNHKFTNIPEAPSIIKVQDELLQNEKVVTEVHLEIQGGYIHDYMTVYWTGKKTSEITENAVYRFPINAFEKSQKIYIDDDVNSLMIVPTVFRNGKFEIHSIKINKYEVK